MSKKILAAEDSPTILEMMKQSLEEAGFFVITAADGQDALDKARTQKPDLIVLDLMLPKIDGYKVCRMLKFDEKYKNIPIVILTARSSDADKKLASEVRADAYMVKPFEPEALLTKIKEFV
jgi:DNA-binding response OmpR family regulator